MGTFFFILILAAAVFFAVKFARKPEPSIDSTQSGAKPVRATGNLPFDLEPSTGGDRFVLAPRAGAGEYLLVGDTPFSIRQFGRTMPVPTGSLVFYDPGADGAQGETRRARAHIFELVAGPIWRVTQWSEDRILHSFLIADEPDEVKIKDWLGDIVLETGGEFRGGSVITTGKGWTAGLAADSVEGKAHSALTSQALFAAEQERGDVTDPYGMWNPARIQAAAFDASNSYSARAIAISLQALARGAAEAGADGGPIFDQVEARSSTARDFPVQTGRLIDPLGVRTQNFYVSGDGDWTMRLGDGLSLSDKGFVTQVGDLIIGPKGITTQVLGMEVGVGSINPFDTDRKAGKTNGFFGEKDDTEMTLLGTRKKKDKKDEGFTFKW